jgi:hypothetical protein
MGGCEVTGSAVGIGVAAAAGVLVGAADVGSGDSVASEVSTGVPSEVSTGVPSVASGDPAAALAV